MWTFAGLALVMAQIAPVPTSDYKTGANLVEALFEQMEEWVLESRTALTQFAGPLSSSTVQSAPLVLSGGARYAIIGYCDEGCSDLRLVLSGPTGRISSEPIGSTEDQPGILIESSVAGAHEVVVNMNRCAKDQCFYAVRVYRL